MEVAEILKKLLLLKVPSPKLLKHRITFFVEPFLIFLMRQTLNDDFWELHKNMNCAFPLRPVNSEIIRKP